MTSTHIDDVHSYLIALFFSADPFSTPPQSSIHQFTHTTMEPAGKRKLDAEAADEEPLKKRVIGPSLPPPQPSDSHDSNDKDSPSGSDSDSDSDDDFGPGLPPSLGGAQPTQQTSVQSTSQISETQKKETQRDEWMLLPPSQSDWASKIDPTQLRNRKFQTGKSARAPGSKQVDAKWVETPEERMRRLQDEMMGVGAAPNRAEQRTSNTKDTTRNKAMEEQIKKFNVSFASGSGLHCFRAVLEAHVLTKLFIGSNGEEHTP